MHVHVVERERGRVSGEISILKACSDEKRSKERGRGRSSIGSGDMESTRQRVRRKTAAGGRADAGAESVRNGESS